MGTIRAAERARCYTSMATPPLTVSSSHCCCRQSVKREIWPTNKNDKYLWILTQTLDTGFQREYSNVSQILTFYVALRKCFSYRAQKNGAKNIVAQRKDNLLGSTTLPADDMSTLPTQWSGRQRVAFDYSISLSVFSLHKSCEAIKRKYHWLKLMITTFFWCQSKYVMQIQPLIYIKMRMMKKQNHLRVYSFIWEISLECET